MQSLALHAFHQDQGAHFVELNGGEAVSDYGDALAEHAALCQSAGLFDLSFRSRLCITGADRVRFLHGQVTNDVKRLQTGSGCYAALITAKGKMQSDLNLYSLADELLLDFESGLTQTISDRLEKYIIADDVQVVDVSALFGLLSIQGPKASEALQTLGLFPNLPSRPFAFVNVQAPDLGELYLMNAPRLNSQGFDLFAPVSALQAIVEKLLAGLASLGGHLGGWQAFELARIEAGIPRFGADMDETNIPLEAGLEQRAVSFNKGCYIGQEVISRIHTFGQVAKALRGLRLADNLKNLPSKGAKLFHDTKEVGYITSAAHSPRLHANIALGYVRKEVNQIGTELRLALDDGDSFAKIVQTPFTV
jgi:folate-binding protein YgfZ